MFPWALLPVLTSAALYYSIISWISHHFISYPKVICIIQKMDTVMIKKYFLRSRTFYRHFVSHYCWVGVYAVKVQPGSLMSFSLSVPCTSSDALSSCIIPSSDPADVVSRAKTWIGSRCSALLTNEAHPCAKFNKSAALPFPHSPLQPFFLHAGLSPPPPTHQRYCTHLLPFQMVMALNHAGALQLEVNSLFLRREFMDCHAVFFKVWLSKHWEIFPCGRIIFGHSLSSLPQYTTGLWLLLSCIMEQNPVSVPALCTKPSPPP